MPSNRPVPPHFAPLHGDDTVLHNTDADSAHLDAAKAWEVSP